MERRVLIVEDDPEIAGLVDMHLRDHGFAPERAADGPEGLERAAAGGYDLVILDLMLPGLDGLELCRRLRERGSRVPLLMLTARSEEIDKVLGLELGADDYLTKPFGIRELLARVKALLRRSGGGAEGTGPEQPRAPLVFGALAIHLDQRKVTLEGRPVSLTAKEFDLLALFAGHPGVAYSREQLLAQVWGYHYAGYEHTVNSHINRLRAKIERDPSHPRYIRTVWGFGYRFAEPEELQA